MYIFENSDKMNFTNREDMIKHEQIVKNIYFTPIIKE